MTSLPSPQEIPEEIPVHFDWDPQAIKEQTVPDCRNREAVTAKLHEVTCQQCIEGIVDIVNVWLRPRGPGQRSGPR